MMPSWVSSLPAVNASLNGLAFVLLVVGWVLIRRGHRDAHKKTMLSAFATSIVFLATYLIYHGARHHYTGAGQVKFLEGGGTAEAQDSGQGHAQAPAPHGAGQPGKAKAIHQNGEGLGHPILSWPIE